MTSLELPPNFSEMTTAEKAAWVDANMDAIVASPGRTTHHRGDGSPLDGIQGPPPEPEVLLPTSVRLHKDTVAELDRRFGNTRGGRAAYIRSLVERDLARLAEEEKGAA